HNILAPIDVSTTAAPVNIVIGEPNTPLTRAPIIRLDSIFNTVFDSTLAINPANMPRTAPTVNIAVNGQLKGLDIISSTAQPFDAAQAFAFPIVSTTGRTAVRALGIDRLRAAGTVRNFTASRSATPFQSGFSG